MFKTNNQKTRIAYAEFYGIEIGEVYYCDICQTWDHADPDSGWGNCGCF